MVTLSAVTIIDIEIAIFHGDRMGSKSRSFLFDLRPPDFRWAMEVAPGPPQVFSTTDRPTLYENRNRSRLRSFSKIGSRSIDIGESEIVTGLVTL